MFWFIREPAASITRPLRELKYFEKAEIPAGAAACFRFVIDPDRDLSFPDADGKRILEDGEIVLLAGPRQAKFRVANVKGRP